MFFYWCYSLGLGWAASLYPHLSAPRSEIQESRSPNYAFYPHLSLSWVGSSCLTILFVVRPIAFHLSPLRQHLRRGIPARLHLSRWRPELRHFITLVPFYFYELSRGSSCRLSCFFILTAAFTGHHHQHLGRPCGGLRTNLFQRFWRGIVLRNGPKTNLNPTQLVRIIMLNILADAVVDQPLRATCRQSKSVWPPAGAAIGIGAVGAGASQADRAQPRRGGCRSSSRFRLTIIAISEGTFIIDRVRCWPNNRPPRRLRPSPPARPPHRHDLRNSCSPIASLVRHSLSNLREPSGMPNGLYATQQFLAQCIVVSRSCSWFLMNKFAWKKVLAHSRRANVAKAIEESLANADRIKQELADRRKRRG